MNPARALLRILHRCVWLCVPALAAAERNPGLLVEPRVSLSNDFQVGLRAGYGGLPLGGGALVPAVEFEMRPLPRPVRMRETATFSHQYRESRFTIGPAAIWQVPLGIGDGGWSGLLGAGAAYSFGSYRGTARHAPSGWHGFGEAGLAYGGEPEADFYWAFTAQVRPLPGVLPVRLLVQMGWRFR